MFLSPTNCGSGTLGGLLAPAVATPRRGSAPPGCQSTKPESGFSLLSLVSKAKTASASNGCSISYPPPDFTSMYSLQEKGESQSEEPEEEDNNYLSGSVHTDMAEQEADGCGIEDILAPNMYDGPATVSLNLDNVKDMLRCVNCQRFLFPPILQCLAGHMECKSCFEVKSQCGKCHQKMVEVPAKFAELVAEQFKVQCAYAEKGCKESLIYKTRRDHEEICPFKPVQCPEFDCNVTRPMNEIFKHFRLEHHHHFVNAHGNVFNGDIRCDDSNMIMGVERKWAPTMMKLEEASGGADDASGSRQGMQHFFLEILRTKHGVWHMWIWYLGEPDEAVNFRCEIAIRKRGRDEEAEIRYTGRVHSIRIPPHRIILSGCLLSFSDYTAAHFRYLGEGHQGHPVIDYRVSVNKHKRLLSVPGTAAADRKRSSSTERAKTASLTKMLRRFSIDSGGQSKANKPTLIQDD